MAVGSFAPVGEALEEEIPVADREAALVSPVDQLDEDGLDLGIVAEVGVEQRVDLAGLDQEGQRMEAEHARQTPQHGRAGAVPSGFEVTEVRGGHADPLRHVRLREAALLAGLAHKLAEGLVRTWALW
jgi:hypothetical protein